MQKRSEDAVGQAIGLLVALTLVTGAIGYVLWEARPERLDEDAAAQASQEDMVQAMLEVILDNQGVGWGDGPDALDRLGLGNVNGTGVSLAHLQALQAGRTTGMDPDNGAVDRDEALLALGLDPDKWGMRLEITPKVSLEITETERALAAMRVALVADWEKLVGVSVDLDTDEEAMVAEARAEVSTRMATGAARDRQLLVGMGMDYDDQIHLGATFPQVLVDLPAPLPDLPLYGQISNVTLMEGDVYPDHKEYLVETLQWRLDEYELIVIGSHVDHKALQEGELKHAIHEWVEAGGILVVLGSTQSSQSWLDPYLTGAAYETGIAGPIYSPDTRHIALRSPNNLQWSAYDFQNTAWNITTSQTPGWAEFTHVLKAEEHSVLAISQPGVFGDGKLAFSSLPIDAVWDTVGEAEAARYMANVILYAGLDIYDASVLRFGGPVPTDLPVAHAHRTTQSWYPGYGLVPLDADLWIWKLS